MSGSVDGTVRVWNAENGAELALLRGHEGYVHRVSYSLDGRRIASGSVSFGGKNNTVRVWDARTYECLEVIQGYGDVKVSAAGASKFPLCALARVHETVIERADNGKPLVWFPVGLADIANIVTHPSGRAWARAMNNHLYIITLEGGRGKLS